MGHLLVYQRRNQELLRVCCQHENDTLRARGARDLFYLHFGLRAAARNLWRPDNIILCRSAAGPSSTRARRLI
jgi:hypothetical protein